MVMVVQVNEHFSRFTTSMDFSFFSFPFRLSFISVSSSTWKKNLHVFLSEIRFFGDCSHFSFSHLNKISIALYNFQSNLKVFSFVFLTDRNHWRENNGNSIHMDLFRWLKSISVRKVYNSKKRTYKCKITMLNPPVTVVFNTTKKNSS